ncbi:MAG: DUF4178 domain-containing protein [Geminicoccaceae bacterium]|nr:DUF4178 domain-containing protein [Geminicoccaceae bacterium]
MITTPETLRSIQCTSCAAPLPLKGGHQVRSLVCSYCGAVMDAHADFAILAQYRNLERPSSPFGIGMEGQIKGVPFAIIGTVAYRSRDEWGVYDWVSYQIFSPTHGYAWLTWNDAHVIFSRRVRDLPDPPVLSDFHRKGTVTFRDRIYRQYERYEANITFVEGELTWLAHLGDTTSIVEAISPPFVFEYEQSGSELEYTLSEYIPRSEAEAAFCVNLGASRSADIHPAQPFEESAFTTAIASVGPFATAAALCGLLMTWVIGGGTVVLNDSFGNPASGLSPLSFEIHRPNQLVNLEMRSPVDNGWAYYDVSIEDDEGEPILELGSEISYYHGYDDGHWSEGSQTTSTLFRVPAAGRYNMEIELDPESVQVPPLQVRILEGAMPGRYFTGLLAISILCMAMPAYRRWKFEKKRWDDTDD